MRDLLNQPYLRSVSLRRDEVESFDAYPFHIPAVRELRTLKLDPKVTFFVGDNGLGKSTLLEAIAVACGFNAEGGSKNFQFSTRETHSALYRHLALVRSPRPPSDGFFFRAESYYNVASNVDDLGVAGSYGRKSLHAMSHGESFLALMQHRLTGGGLYLFDEPEAALSPSRQLQMLAFMHNLVALKSQFIVATHSPILMAYPGALIYSFGADGIERCDYEQTDHYQVTRRMLENREPFLRAIFGEDG